MLPKQIKNTNQNKSYTAKPKRYLLLGFIFLFLFGSFLAARLPSSQASTLITFDIPTDIKEFIVKPLVRKIANSLANKLANRVYEKISGQTDDHEPFFILSWRNLILESQARGNDTFRSILKGTDICSHIKDSVILSFGADFAEPISGNSVADDTDGGFRTFLGAPGSDPFDVVNKCTIDFDIDAFKEDFSNGGWEAWDKLIQPQNNFLGMISNALDEQSKQESIDQQSGISQAIAGQGFLPNRIDKTNGRAGGPRGCNIGGPNRCTILGRVIAPEKLFGEAATQTINTKIGSYYNAIEFTDVVTLLFDSIVQGVMGRLTDFSGFDVAKFAEEQFAADRSDGEDARQGAADSARQTCQSNCAITATSQCDANLPPQEFQQCRADAIAICLQRCP